MEERSEVISDGQVDKMNYAGFWLRLGGFIIDGLLVFTVTAPLGVWASVSTPWLRAGGYLVVAPFILLSIAVVVGFLYFTLFWTWRGQTPGKMLIRAKVVRTNGETLSFGHAALRFLGFLVCFLTIYVGFIMIAFNMQKRGLHDTIADTCVINLRARLTKDNTT
jgi:uncharacterized RDD family membrane protein YckC|tara:strand:- start:325 stop:816 length:492 start_codon:yes stop_codon:yes gene_type:complete